jgi:hypothetical protein
LDLDDLRAHDEFGRATDEERCASIASEPRQAVGFDMNNFSVDESFTRIRCALGFVGRRDDDVPPNGA